MSSTRVVFEQQMNQLAAQLPILGGAQKHTVEYERFRMLSPESSPDSVYFSPKVKTDLTLVHRTLNLELYLSPSHRPQPLRRLQLQRDFAAPRHSGRPK